MQRTEIKAISLKQPWANLIYRGEKTVETRTWRTEHRGDLLICSTKRPAIPPAGMALCIVEVVGCRPMVRADEAAACCELYQGAWAWELRNIRKLKVLFSVRGSQGFYMVKIRPGQLDTV